MYKLRLTLKRYIFPEERQQLLKNIEGQYNNIIMEYQKIANLLDNETNQLSKFRTRNWIEINDESRGTYTNNDIKFKCDYADAYILVKGNITITGAGDDDAEK